MAKKTRKKTKKAAAATARATPVPAAALAPPGTAFGGGNVINAARLSEKTIELTACAQFGNHFGKRMVWFGLTQKQERQHGFDAASNLGGRPFILQFKASSTVLKTGNYAGSRRFSCQHHQMQRLRSHFGNLNGQCYYFLPNIGTFNELNAAAGDLLANSYLVDVASLPARIPRCHRKSGYHYAYLDAPNNRVEITSNPFLPEHVFRANKLPEVLKRERLGALGIRDFIGQARELERADERLAKAFYRNAALIVIV